MTMRPASSLLMLVAIAAQASAANVYKCPNADGKIEYRDTACTAAPGKKLETNFNSIDTAPNPAVAKRVQEFDSQVNKRLERDALVRQQNAAAADAKYRECRDYDDQAARQTAWLKSRSEAARASARTEIAIAERKWIDAGCR